ncbi:MAG: N5-glutamine methyltransferase family protein [Acidimicrobiales bacterium]
MTSQTERYEVANRLAAAGCVAPLEEADELIAAADEGAGPIHELVRRRVAGEPLAWVTGSTRFAGQRVLVRPGVYVPRWQSEPLARRAGELLPVHGVAVDLCTGTGAVALTMMRLRPSALVLATDLDPTAVRCALDNGVDARLGDLAAPLPRSVTGRCDVVTAVAPYVPGPSIAFLPRDVREHEPMGALDGGPDGTVVLRRVLSAASTLLHPGGRLLVELGGTQDKLLEGALESAGFGPPSRLEDDEGDLRGIETRLGPAIERR